MTYNILKRFKIGLILFIMNMLEVLDKNYFANLDSSYLANYFSTMYVCISGFFSFR